MNDFFSNDALRVLCVLRDAAALPDECFPLNRFVGMLSDEIEALRAKGTTDDEIVALISTTLGKPSSGADLEAHYVLPDRRLS